MQAQSLEIYFIQSALFFIGIGCLRKMKHLSCFFANIFRDTVKSAGFRVTYCRTSTANTVFLRARYTDSYHHDTPNHILDKNWLFLPALPSLSTYSDADFG